MVKSFLRKFERENCGFRKISPAERKTNSLPKALPINCAKRSKKQWNSFQLPQFPMRRGAFPRVSFHIYFPSPSSLFCNYSFENKHAFLDPWGDRFSRSPPFVAWIHLNMKSPIISPDHESGTCRKFSFEKPPTIYRFFALPYKPGLCFDQPESPEIAARQKIFSTKGGV